MSNDHVKLPEIRATLKKATYRTDDIIAQVQEVIQTDVDDTAVYARKFQPTVDGMRQLYNEVYDRITYVEDPNFYQWVQTPSFLWHHTRRGDCKSLAVFLSTVLQNMGVPHLIRYTSYSRIRKYTHVYVIAIINGEKIPLDITYGKQEAAAFGDEKPYAEKKDFYMKPGLYKLGTTVPLNTAEKAYLKEVEQSIEEMRLSMADVSDDVINADGGDITLMTKGQLDRKVWKDRFGIYAKQEIDPVQRRKLEDAAVAMEIGTLSGIHGLAGDPLGQQVDEILRKTTSNAPAFQDFKLVLGNAPADPAIRGLFDKVGDFFKKVGETFSDLFKKFVNWIWKGPAKIMGGHFLFLFAAPAKILSAKIKQRMKAQEKSLKFILDKGKFSREQLMGVMRNGIKENTGFDPSELFNAAKSSHINALPAMVLAAGKYVVKAIGWVIQVIQKIAGLFKGKKEDAGNIDQSTTSDVQLLEEESRLHEEARNNNGKLPAADSEGGGGTGKAILAALALGVPLLLRAG